VTDSAPAIPPALTVETHAIDPISSLLPILDAQAPLLFVRRGDGIAGFGETLRLEFHGPDRIREAADAWRRISAAAHVTDPVGVSGTGLIAFGAFTFDNESERASVLIVPEVIVGRRDGASWVTRINGSELKLEKQPMGAEYRIALHAGTLDGEGYKAAVAEAVRRIRAGELSKVVLARDLIGHLPEEADLRRVLVDLALGYPDTWTFAVDGLLGSSPETLVRVNHGVVTARVLAGSIGRGVDAEADHAAALTLATSTKDLDEHRFAVQSVLAALAGHATGVVSSEMPFTLKLPNLWHLASDVEGSLSDGSTALDLAAALHPTAAVAGAPTAAALDVIRELEPVDRRRYGGPVGWVDGNGGGKWAVAVRSAEVTADGRITAYAGAGIVADSDPDRELAETRLKFRPIVEAFG
jgi:menaquinone-specific isochorismate synthase